ncbi:hypothetical protein Tco_1201389 [Tanacetum coccineum]
MGTIGPFLHRWLRPLLPLCFLSLLLSPLGLIQWGLLWAASSQPWPFLGLIQAFPFGLPFGLPHASMAHSEDPEMFANIKTPSPPPPARTRPYTEPDKPVRIVSRLRGALKILTLKDPGFGERKSQYLDIVVFTGGTHVKTPNFGVVLCNEALSNSL